MFILAQTLTAQTLTCAARYPPPRLARAPLFTLAFAMPWEDLELTSPYSSRDKDFSIWHFHIRCLRVIPSNLEWPCKNETGGIKLERALWEEKTEFLKTQKRLRLREIRMSAAIRVQNGGTHPYFSTLTLTDDFGSRRSGFPPISEEVIKFTAGPTDPTTTFQLVVSQLLTRWAHCWTSVLDEIDQIVSVNVRLLRILATIYLLLEALRTNTSFRCRTGRGCATERMGRGPYV